MRIVRGVALALLLITCLLCLPAELVAPANYATQFREAPNAPPSRAHLLGTDDLGRDRFSRVLYGTRISLLLAPAAALLTTALALIIGGAGGYLGGLWERGAMAAINLCLSLPWLFLLLAVRALLPLDTPPLISIAITFLLLGSLGWAPGARVLCAAARQLRNSEFLLQARAQGIRGWRLFLIQIAPNFKPVLQAQFWMAIPVFIVSEANLGVLGLGVAEPMPSWGGLLRELEAFSGKADAVKLVPLLLLAVVVGSFQVISSREEVMA